MAKKRKSQTFDEMVTELEATIRADEKAFYGEKLVDESLNPQNVGELEHPDGAAQEIDQEGYTMQIHLRIENGTITDSKFITSARGPTIGFGSVVTELVKDKTVEEALKIETKDVASVLGGLPEGDEHTPELALRTLKAALVAYQKKQ